MTEIAVVNRGPLPVTVEELDPSGTTLSYVAIATGERRVLPTTRGRVWIGRDVRRRCLSRFVPEDKPVEWQIAGDGGDDYEKLNVGRFLTYVAPEFSRHDSAVLKKCLDALEASAKRIEGIVPPSALDKLSNVPIWLEFEPDKSYFGLYYGSRDWLIKNGVSLAKEKSIQFTSALAVIWGQDWNPLMHELAHAYHHQVLSFSYAPILDAFARAKASGRYNAVRSAWGGHQRAYGLTNAAEFFAELSAAYFDKESSPFTRADLKEFDPESYRVIKEAWERPIEAAPKSPWLEIDAGTLLRR